MTINNFWGNRQILTFAPSFYFWYINHFITQSASDITVFFSQTIKVVYIKKVSKLLRANFFILQIINQFSCIHKYIEIDFNRSYNFKSVKLFAILENIILESFEEFTPDLMERELYNHILTVENYL